MSTRRSSAHESKKSASCRIADEFTPKIKSDFKDILTKIAKNPLAEPFLYPVDKSAYPEYYEVIEHPMDFATLKKSLNDFAKLGEALEALRLIWRNCLEFNVEGSEIASNAVNLGSESEKLIQDKFGEDVVSFGWNTHKKKSKRGETSRSCEPVVTKEKEPISSGNKADRRKSKRPEVEVSLTSATMKDILKTIQASEFAAPFEKPVNEEDAPGYFDVIKTPMDLMTIKKKLRNGGYDDRSADFVHDIRLISENCITYNDPDSSIADSARSFAALFDELLVPFQIDHESAPTRKRVKENKTASVRKREEQKETSEGGVEEKEEEEQEEEEVVIKVKVEKKKGQQPTDVPPFNAVELLGKLEEFEFAEPFLYPVDIRTAPGYTTVISTPMDLSTVEKKLKKGQYGIDLVGFVEDVRLIWDNCKTYNASDSEIFHWAAKCSEFFESELKAANSCKKDHKTKVAHAAVETKKDKVKEKTEPMKIASADKHTKQTVDKSAIVDVCSPQEHQHFLRLLQTTANKNKDLLKMAEVLQMDCAERTLLVREHCQKRAAEKFRDIKNGCAVVPGLLEVVKFGEISSRTVHTEDVILPFNFVSVRPMRICLVPDDVSRRDSTTVVPFVPVNVKSSVIPVKENNSIKFRLSLDNGVILCEDTNPRTAWASLFGKEIKTLCSIGSKLRRCRAVFNRVCTSPDSVPFLEQIPVDSSEGSNYYKAISAPMWFREIHKRLVGGVYDNEYDFAWDMRLVFRNCQNYNQPRSGVYLSSERLSVLFESLFLNWVVNIQDKSVDDPAQGEWDSWGHLRYFDQKNPDEHFCMLSKQHVNKSELLQCAWCEDEYLPSSVNLPPSKAGLRTWACSRCTHAKEIAGGDLSTDPYAQHSPDFSFSNAEVGGSVFNPSPQYGVGWNQARRKQRSGGLKHHYLSPLGYEIFSPDDIAAQKEFEDGIDEDLLSARAKEFKEQNVVVGKKSFHRRKGRKDRKKQPIQVEVTEDAVEAGEEEIPQSSPIDAKFLEEEGRIITGKLVDFSVPEGFQLKWFVNSNEQRIVQQYQAGEDISSLFDWKHELQEEDLHEFGFFGFDCECVRARIEALANAPVLKEYKFLLEAQAKNELMHDIQQQLHSVSKASSTAEGFHQQLLQKRWKFELERVFPPTPQHIDDSKVDEELVVKLTQWGFKMLVSKAFPAGGVDMLLSIWDLLDSSKPIIGNTYFSLVEMVASLSPPPTLLPIPSQIIFDEICCIFTEQLLLDCRVRVGIDEEAEWQNVLFLHPVNIITWPKILEKCLLLRSLPLSHTEGKMLLDSSVQGDASVHLKVLCLLYNHPHIDYFVGCEGSTAGDVSEALLCMLRNVLQMLTADKVQEKLDNAQFCSDILALFTLPTQLEDPNSAVRARIIHQWLQSLFMRIGFSTQDEAENALLCEESLLSSQMRSWGSFVLSNSKRGHSQFLFPHDFDRNLSVCELKTRSLTFLERSLSLLSCSDSESMCVQDRVAVYTTILDHALSCKAFKDLYEERDRKFQERFLSLPRSDSIPLHANLNAPPSVPRNTVCYLTGIHSSVVNDATAWVVVPNSLLRHEDARRLPETSPSTSAADHAEAAYSLRARRQESPDEPSGPLALKYAVVQLLLCESAAERELEDYEKKMELMAASFATPTSPDTFLQPLFARSQPMGFDRFGNAFWLLNVQENMCIFEHDVRGKTLDPLDSNTREPCVLLRDRSGQWFYHSSVQFSALLSDLSSEIPCERKLKWRFVERLLSARSILSRGTLNIKSAQHVWLERKASIERWVGELSLFSGPNETHRCRQLEVVWARCVEARLNVYTAMLFSDDEDAADRSQRAERDAVLRKQKRIRDTMVEVGFDLHPTLGWSHLDGGTRMRQLTATCTATRLHAEPTTCQTLRSHMARSLFLVKNASVEADADEETQQCNENAADDVAETKGDIMDVEQQVDADTAVKEGKEASTMKKENPDDEEGQQPMDVEESPDDAQPGASSSHSKKLYTRAVEQMHNATGEVVRIYPSGKEAATFMNMAQSGISLCVTGQKTDSNGFRWRNYEGPPIDFDAIAHLQTPLEDLRAMQIMRGRVEDEQMSEKTIGKTHKFYEAIKEAYARYDPRGATRVPAFRHSAVPPSAMTVVPASQAQSSGAALPVLLTSSLSAADRQNFTFPSPPAFPKTQNHIVTSTKTACPKLLKLKGELFNIVFAFPEKGIKWPDLDPAKEVMVREAGEAAVRAVQEAHKNSSATPEEVERLADKASRKARRRLRRKLALDQFATNVQSAVTPQELLTQVLIVEQSIPNVIMFMHNKSALPVYANTAAEVALRVFVLDRAIAYKDIIGLENAPLVCPYKLRVQFSPRCCANPQCLRFLGHVGKCTQAGQLVSRLPDHFQLAPSNEQMARPAAPAAAYSATPRPNVTPMSRPPSQPMRPPDDVLQSLVSIANRPGVDIEFLTPFFPNNTELIDFQWV